MLSTYSRLIFIFLNEKQHQSNCIRKVCKEYNIELQDKTLSSPVYCLKEIENTDQPLNKETEQNDENLIIDNKQDNPEEITNVTQIFQAEPMSTDPQISHKRKADQLVDEQALYKENTPPTKKPTRSTRRKS
ncbi:unnamed protein product [Adineta steineri]|uniref:Uncharacterized protein n=1 Tax=Adineta steineri TaxID=433720 RepID=A0A819BY71_9BILA|nr:unnamed protein product [Adineta steineri]CAF3805417.1 unnamed protein product [Adineta steineri]